MSLPVELKVFGPVQLIASGLLPPVATTEMEPSLLPHPASSITDCIKIGSGSGTATSTTLMHPFAS